MDEELREKNQDQEDLGKPPIYLIELILLPLPFAVLADIVDIFSLTGAGAVISLLLDVVSMGVINLWLIFKGRRAEWMMIASAIEFIPAVDIIPWRTATLIILYLKDKKIVRKLSEKSTPKIAGFEKLQSFSEKTQQLLKKI